MSSTFILRVVGALGICLVIVLSVIPAEAQIRTGSPKVLEHAAAYLVLALVLSSGYRSVKWAGLAVAVLLATLSGVLELIQFWSPGRTPSMADWFASILGATMGVVLTGIPRMLRERYLDGQARPSRPLVENAEARRLYGWSEADEGTRR